MARAWALLLVAVVPACAPEGHGSDTCNGVGSGPPAIAYGSSPASDYGEYFVVWPEHQSTTEKLLYGAWIGPGDGPPYAVGQRISNDDDVDCGRPAVAHGDGLAGTREAFVALWNGDCGLGRPNGEFLTCATFSGAWSALVSTGEEFFAVFPAGGVYGARVTTSPETVGTVVMIDGGEAHAPDLAFDGTDHLVAWDTGGSLFARRIHTDGSVIGAGPLVVSSSGSAADARVIYAGGGFIIVWGDAQAGAVEAALISSAGVLQSTRRPIAGDVGNYARPALASNGRDLLVVWEEALGVRARLVGLDLTPRTDVIDLADDDSFFARAPAVASDGDGFMVVWVDEQARVNGVRVDRDGRVLRDDVYSQSCSSGGRAGWLPGLAALALCARRRRRVQGRMTRPADDSQT